MNFTYAIDEYDCLAVASPGYFSFARENCWTGAEASIGEPLWNFISGQAMRVVQQSLLRRLRQTGESVELPFRCDAPEVRREMMLLIEPSGEGRVTFSSCSITEHPRRPQRLLSVEERRGGDQIEMCGWCDRFLVDEDWAEVEQAAISLGLTTRADLPAISHGICSECSERLMAA